jgi:alpha-ketoglutaric semialdehyde dehydrogenase
MGITGETLFVAQNLIEGKFQNGAGPEATSLNPADPNTVIAVYNKATSKDIDDAIAAARGSLDEWAELGLIKRGVILRRVADLMLDRREELAKLMTLEQGKTLAEAQVEIDGSAETIRYHAEAARFMYGRSYVSSVPDERIEAVRQPLGVVAIVTPWNFPAQIPAWKITPALLWGNCVIWKPASDVPAFSFAIASLFHDAGVLPGAFNMVLAPGATTSHLIDSPSISGVSFTGSGQVGNQIVQSCAIRGVKIQLELGGHNAAIVMPDVDLDHAAAQLVIGSMSGTGQKCTATRRIITVGNCHDEFVGFLAKRVQELGVGDGLDPSSQIGPVVSSSAKLEILNAIQDAVSDGGKIVAQAKLPTGDGFYVAPTVIEGDMSIKTCQEEVFGPVTTVMNVATLQKAVEIANSTEFGLTASIFSASHSDIAFAVSKLQAGLVKVNAPNTGSELHVPFGGLKASSFPGPREQNADSVADFYTTTKSVYHRLPKVRES